MTEQINTVIIGAGQAGLAMSYCLKQRGIKNVILEQAPAIAPAWRHRWDSFTLVLPNWTLQLPGFPYQGDDPDGFLIRDDYIAYLEDYAAYINAEIRLNTRVSSVENNQPGSNLVVKTSNGSIEAGNVVIAAGTFQGPKIPVFNEGIAEDISQIHTHNYQNPDALPEGAVMVVGTGQSGCQIAEELYQSGRKVYLCVGGATSLPRFYRGKDSIWWLGKMGFFDQKVDSLSSPEARFTANPFLSGKDGGHTLNLHQFARDGVRLLGHMKGAQDFTIYLYPDLKENLSKIDDFIAEFKQHVDKFIEENQLDAEAASPEPGLENGYEAEIVETLDLKTEGINTIIWATGYQFNFNWVKLPVLDEYGYPIQVRGLTEYPGLYFLGLHWLYKRRSGLPWGVGDDAVYIAEDIAGR